MTDKELLELAAKAVSIDLSGATFDAWGEVIQSEWNPLANDGEALRLAVKLGMHIEFPNDNLIEVCNCFERRNGDPYAATRRAIVRGAATESMCWVD